MILQVLLKNEFIKTSRRLAFWVTLGMWALMNTMGWGGNWWRARNNPERTFGLPDAWGEIFEFEMVMMCMVFGCAVMILLVSNEFSWRTARQNVIDGLTKEQFFLAKLLTLPLVALVFMSLGPVIWRARSPSATLRRPRPPRCRAEPRRRRDWNGFGRRCCAGPARAPWRASG